MLYLGAKSDRHKTLEHMMPVRCLVLTMARCKPQGVTWFPLD